MTDMLPAGTLSTGTLSMLAGPLLALDSARALPWLLRASASDLFVPDRAVLVEGTSGAGRLYEVTAGGIALVPVAGVLVHRLGWIDPWGWWTGYDILRVQIETALADDAVRAVALIVNSPGGEGMGCLELARWVAEVARGDKPVVAVVDGLAASAAYWLASATALVALTPSGLVGSIGTVITHIDMSAMLAEWGIAVEHIYSGARKVDGSPFKPLGDDARAVFQDSVDRFRARFAADVAGNRGLDVAAVMATEADVFDGLAVGGKAPAVATGLADIVLPPDEVLARLTAELDATPTN